MRSLLLLPIVGLLAGTCFAGELRPATGGAAITGTSISPSTVTADSITVSTLTVGTNTLKTVDGKVGVGTSAPQSGSKLHVKTGASSAVMPTNNGFLLENDANGGIGIAGAASTAQGLYFHGPSASYDSGFEYDTTARTLTVKAGGSRVAQYGSAGDASITGPLTVSSVTAMGVFGQVYTATATFTNTDNAQTIGVQTIADSLTKVTVSISESASGAAGYYFEALVATRADGTIDLLKVVKNGTPEASATGIDIGTDTVGFRIVGSALEIRADSLVATNRYVRAWATMYTGF